jgi:hypothetical protein
MNIEGPAMSETPLPELNYETPPPHGSAPTLVRLAAIFQFVSAGIDLIYGIGMISMAGFMYYQLTTAMAAAAAAGPGGPAGVPPGPTPPPREMIYMVLAIYGGPGLLSLLAIAPKVIAAFKLMGAGPGSWKWGLTAGIICCCQLWMIHPCCVPVVLPLGAGIYTIVICCLPHVRAYLGEAGVRPTPAP